MNERETDLRVAELRRLAAQRVATMPDYPDPPDTLAERDLERDGWLALQSTTGVWRGW